MIFSLFTLAGMVVAHFLFGKELESKTKALLWIAFIAGKLFISTALGKPGLSVAFGLLVVLVFMIKGYSAKNSSSFM
jgi:hypothetical protein